MLLSEMVLDGIVVDIGHEATQIVPFIDGRASYHKSVVYPVGGMFVDSILASRLISKREDLSESDLHFNFSLGNKKETNFRRSKNDIVGIAYDIPNGPKLAKEISLRDHKRTSLLDGIESFFDA